MKHSLILFLTFAYSFSHAAIKGVPFEYKEGGTTLDGYVAYDDSLKGKLPGVVIVHDWMGNGAYSKMRADQMAKLGYIALAADIYGKGVRPANNEEAAKIATEYRSGDRAKLRARAKAAFDALATHPKTKNTKMVAMGYCFGGTTVLEMARSGLPLAGVVSFHGGLSTLHPEDAKNIKTKLLVLHGAIDPFVKAEEVAAFQKEMNDAGVDYQFISYSGAVHGFTEKHVGTDTKAGMAYNESADKRSFEAMKNFFSEVLK